MPGHEPRHLFLKRAMVIKLAGSHDSWNCAVHRSGQQPGTDSEGSVS